jgi:hypothetical protein
LLPSWIVPATFLGGFGLVLIGNILAFVYRKPGVQVDYFWNGRPEDPAPPTFFRMTYVKTLIQPDKYSLVHGVTFVGVSMVFGIVVFMVVALIFQLF